MSEWSEHTANRLSIATTCWAAARRSSLFRSTLSPSSSEFDRVGTIQVQGARENNLQNISVDIPRRRVTAFTGVSGARKSSLVFDTISAESRRLLNETFSTFVQNFLPRCGQPDVDVLANLSTAIIVDQQLIGGNPRSTLGTGTDIFTPLRVLFSRLASASDSLRGVLPRKIITIG